MWEFQISTKKDMKSTFRTHKIQQKANKLPKLVIIPSNPLIIESQNRQIGSIRCSMQAVLQVK